MRKTTKLDVVWMLVSVLFLLNQVQLHEHMNDIAFQVIRVVAIAQLAFGLVINPLLRKFDATRRAALSRDVAAAIREQLAQK